MGVTNHHILYEKRKRQWTVIRDCIEGEDAIKGKGEIYLPRAKGYDLRRYEAYKLRAEWVNYTRRVLTGLHGLVFRKSPTLTCPDKLKYISDNCDRKGTSLYRFASETFKDSLPVTHGGLLVDMPCAESVTTVLDAENKKISPYIKYYRAENIINWKFDIVNGVEQLCMVVLEEEYEAEDQIDEFSHDIKLQYRVLDIFEGKYRQRVFRSEGKKSDNYTSVEIPITINGQHLDYIPFFPLFETEPGTPFMLDLARANISHYRKSADYENGVHLTTIPTAYVTGHEQTTYEDDSKEEIGLGEDVFLFIPEADAKVGTLCFAGEGLSHSEKALETSASNMAILGSRLVVTEKGTSESADSAKIHRAGENASLADLANMVADAFTKALRTIGKWIGVEGEIKFELCTDYDTLAFDANALNSIANLSRENKMPLPYVFDILKNGEYTPVTATLEEYAALLDMEANGYSPSEIVEQYRAIKEGKKIAIRKKTKTNDNPPLNDDNQEKNGEDTDEKPVENEE